MKKITLLAILLLCSFSLMGQVVSIYCTWDDLEAARQQRIFGSGITAMLQSAGYTVSDASFPNRATADALIKSDTRLIIGSSHGDEHTFYDCNDWSAIWTSNSPTHFGAMAGKIVHLLACLNGQHLAPTMADECSSSAVLAYTATFNFSNDSSYNDMNARADAEFDRALVQENCTAQQAFQKAKNKFIEYANNASAAGNAAEYETLMHNANCIALFGDGNARLLSNVRSSSSVQQVSALSFAKPSAAVLQKILVARGSRSVDYQTYQNAINSGQRMPASVKFYKNLSEQEFTQLCLDRYSNLSASYKLGLRLPKLVLMDKYQIMNEIRSNTPTGKFLVLRYKKFLQTLEKIMN